jgi:DNA-binding NarL/FixJ family response regulator
MHRTRVVIADRHPVVLQGISSAFATQSDFRIVASCGDGSSCIEAIRSLVPDIAIVDLAIPDPSGPEILAIVNSEGLATRVVIFATSVEGGDLTVLAAAGAYAVVMKDAEPEMLVQAVREVAQGRKLLPLLSSDQDVWREPAASEKSLTRLTYRQRQIMRLVSQGLSNKEIGRRLNIADGTIKVHLHHIFRKLDISNRTVLAALAISQNEMRPAPRKVDPRGSSPRRAREGQ